MDAVPLHVDAVLIDENRKLTELLRTADLATPVPTCPGWSLLQLMRHVGRGDRWAAEIVTTRASGPVDPRSVEGGKPPDDLDGALAWLGESPRKLLDAVAVEPDAPVWTFTGPKPAQWWVRRRLHESTVHRGDAALALGVPYEIDPAVAADGIGEWLGLVAARADRPILPVGATLHVHVTDTAGEWTVTGGATGVTVAEGHAKGDVAVRGAAADLLLGIVRRIPADDERLEVLGDRGTWSTWLANTGF